MALVGLGFVVVAIADYMYIKIYGNKAKVSIRRKIFHFVPVGLLPILSQIHYKLFTLMVFGSFYLFLTL